MAGINGGGPEVRRPGARQRPGGRIPPGPTVRRRRFRRATPAVAVGVLVLMICGWLAFRGLQIQRNLEAGRDLVSTLRDDLAARDLAAAQRTVDRLEHHSGQARAAAADPLWIAAEKAPLLGANLAAVGEVAAVTDNVITGAVAPVVERLRVLGPDALTPRDGRIDVAPLTDAAGTLTAAAGTVNRSHSRLERLDSSRLLPSVANPLGEAVSALDRVRGPLGTAARAAGLLPPILGSDGPRTYLVLIQNNAEVRATGGISGAVAVITVENGRIALTGQDSATKIGAFTPPLPVDPEQERIYSSRLGSSLQGANLTPDFPTAASTAKAMWEKRRGGAAVDGVVALDPVVLADILAATGPIDLGGFEDPRVEAFLGGTSLPSALTTDNVVPTLLSDVYAQIDEPALQDEYFAAVAGEVFGALSGGQGDTVELAKALAGSAGDRRLHLWSNFPAEQQLIMDLGLSGAVTGTAAGGVPFGVYFNDETGAKMNFYMRRTAQLTRSCTGGKSSKYTVKVTLANTAPRDAADALPDYVTGDWVFGVPPGRVRTDVVVYGPSGSLLTAARLNGAAAPLEPLSHDTRPVGILRTELGPGGKATLELDFAQVTPNPIGVLRVTPTIQDLAEVVLPTQSSGPCLPPD